MNKARQAAPQQESGALREEPQNEKCPDQSLRSLAEQRMDSTDDRDQSAGPAWCAGQQGRQTRWGGMKESSPKVAPWRAAVAYACEQQWEGEPITDPVEMQITFPAAPGQEPLEQSQGQRGPAAAVGTAALHQQQPRRHRQAGPLHPGWVRGPQRGVPHRRRLTGGVAGIGETLRRAFRTDWGSCSFANRTLNNFLSAAKMGPNWIHSGSALHPFGGSSA